MKKLKSEKVKESVLKTKSATFADRIVTLYKYLSDAKKESVISKQILRSGTSIGANIAEAVFAASKKDFLSKLTISTKECSETIYWLERLHNAEYISSQQFDSLYNDCMELGRILSASIQTIKKQPEFQ